MLKPETLRWFVEAVRLSPETSKQLRSHYCEATEARAVTKTVCPISALTSTSAEVGINGMNSTAKTNSSDDMERLLHTELESPCNP